MQAAENATKIGKRARCGRVSIMRGLATLVLLLSTACGPSSPPRTVASSSAAEVSATEAAPTVAAPVAATEEDEPGADEDDGQRREGDLVVGARPEARTNLTSAFRRQVEGPLTAGAERVWIGPQVPAFVKLRRDDRELITLDSHPDGFLAVYRTPLGLSSCNAEHYGSCTVSAALYAEGGKLLWSYDLDDYISRPEEMDTTDIRYDRSILFFSQTCVRDDRGKDCDRVVAIDTRSSKVSWQSPPGTCSRRLLATEDIVIALTAPTGAGGRISVLSRADGSLVDQKELDFEATTMSLRGGELTVSNGTSVTKRLQISKIGRLSLP